MHGRQASRLVDLRIGIGETGDFAIFVNRLGRRVVPSEGTEVAQRATIP